MFRSIAKITNKQILKTTIQHLQFCSFSNIDYSKLQERVDYIQNKLKPEREKVLKHPLYTTIKNIDHIRIFMEYHVFAVYDFMSFLKSIQKYFANFELPWLPQPDKEFRRAMNEIMIEEETDPYEWGWEGEKFASHFEMYMDSLEQAGADMSPIRNMFKRLRNKENVFEVIKAKDIPVAASKFMDYTFKLVEDNQLHKIAAATTFGREDINHFPVTLLPTVKKIAKETPSVNLSKFIYYWDRHENHGTEHGPQKYKIVMKFAGNDEQKWQEVEKTALDSIKMRVQLWDGMVNDIKKLKV